MFAEHSPLSWHFGGPIGVFCFFALSGFLVTGVLLEHSSGSLSARLKRFYLRRTLRIFPVYYLTLSVLLLAGALPNALWYFTYTTNHLVFRMRAFDPGIGHFWTLAVEEWFYILFPLFLLRSAKPTSLVITLLIASKVIRCALAFNTPAPWFTLLLPVCGEYLLWGALASLAYRNAWSAKLPAWLLCASGLILVTAYYTLRGVPGSGTSTLLLCLDGTPDGLGFALLILGLARWQVGAPSVMSRKSVSTLASPLASLLASPFIGLGRISYALYIFHLIVLQFGLGSRLAESLHLTLAPTLRAYLVDLPLTIAMGIASWYFVEKPCLAAKARFA